MKILLNLKYEFKVRFIDFNIRGIDFLISKSLDLKF